MDEKIYWSIFAFLMIIIVVSFWQIFRKSGRPGWYSLIPLWNLVAMLDVAGKTPWIAVVVVVASRVFTFLMPEISLPVEIVADITLLLIIISVGFIEKFRCGILLAFGLILLPVIFYPVLAFGNYEYEPEEYGYYDEEDINQ